MGEAFVKFKYLNLTLFFNFYFLVLLFVCLFIYLLKQAGFSGSYAADVGLQPTASFPRVLSSTHLPTYERMDS